MITIKEFDLSSSPLAGKNLIEASAGTGKTFTITRLFLRLLLEKQLDVEQILVVTFTEAATHELQERIRDLLYSAKQAFSLGRSEENFLKDYLKTFTEHAKANELLNRAIRNFDQAAIFTIHGFCNKVLQENAFESDSLFDTQLVTEQNDLLIQIVEDFWRKQMYGESQLFLSYALTKVSPESLLQLIANKVGLLYLRIIPQVNISDCSGLEAHFIQSFRELKNSWPSSRDAIRDIFENSQKLNRGLYRKAKMSGLIAAMDAYAATNNPRPVLFKDFDKFSRSRIEDGTKKGCAPPSNPFFDVCAQHLEDYQRLAAAYNQRLIVLKLSLFDYARRELKKRKQERNIFFFDDLLLNLHAALGGDRKQLAATLRERYKAALIDEFQDTDPVQYEIFDQIFNHKDSSLFLIGDPKQAIYGFRGADVFAYIRAKHETPRHYTLSQNYRSDPRLIEAINTIFEKVPRPFVYEDIQFHKVSVPENAQVEQLSVADEPRTPLRIWFVDSTKHVRTGRPLNKSQAREIIIEAVAAEIGRLLRLSREDGVRIGDRSLEERDIAVLVRTNSEARQVQEALARLNVNSVLYSSANLFESREAAELQTILAAVIEPQRERLLRAALATEIIGVAAKGILALDEDEAVLEEWYEKFVSYHANWVKHGFIRMLNDFVKQENVLVRLMTYHDGERRITNILHLGEVLNQAAVGQKLGMTGLLKWLQQQRASRLAPSEEHQLRLESDEQAVKLVTMHMSKGLEYAVVFCPFTWSGSVLWRNGELKFHDESGQRELIIDLGSEDYENNKVIAEKEELAENLRLLYVALTRAKHRCYLIWGRFNEGPSSALAYLFHQPGMLLSSDVVTTLRNYVKDVDDRALREDLAKIARVSNGTIAIEDPPKDSIQPLARFAETEVDLTYRQFIHEIDVTERVSSYSALVTQQPYASESADYDAIAMQSVQYEALRKAALEQDFSSFVTFPAGARTGNFVHALLQHLDFTDPASDLCQQQIKMFLQQYGFAKEWDGAVTNMLQRLVASALDGSGAFSLSKVKWAARLNELEFYFPLKTISVKTLKNLFVEVGTFWGAADFPSKIEELSFAPFKGFMKGYIDLVFNFQGRYYLIDWKTNYLGATVDSYDQEALRAAMVENFYILQYHLYVLALHQYLKRRMPHYDYEKHFGGVFYIFVRGLDLASQPEVGVFSDRPPSELISQLAASLIA